MSPCVHLLPSVSRHVPRRPGGFPFLPVLPLPLSFPHLTMTRCDGHGSSRVLSLPLPLPHRTSPSPSTSRRRLTYTLTRILALAFAVSLITVVRVSGQSASTTCDFAAASAAGAKYITTDTPSASTDFKFASDGHTTWSNAQLSFNPPTPATVTSGATTSYGAIASWSGKRHIESGFQVSFNMQYSGGSNTDTGFALIISKDIALSSGSSSGNTLGYASIPNAFAIEFDCKADSSLGETAPQHVTVQSSIGLPAISPASTATVSTPVFSSPPAGMCGASTSPIAVTLTYTPLNQAIPGATSGMVSLNIGGVTGKIYLKQDIRQVLADTVNQVYLPAFFGFTTSVNTGTKWQLTLSNIQIQTLGANPANALITSPDGTFGKGLTPSLPVNNAQTTYTTPPTWMPRAYAVDYCGNKLGSAGVYAFQAQLQQNGAALNSATQQAKVDPIYTADGSFPIQLWSSQTGTFQLVVSLQGSTDTIPGSPFSVTFVAGAIAPANSIALVGADPTMTFTAAAAYAQTAAQLTFQAELSVSGQFTKPVYIWAVDQFNNPVPYGTGAGQSQGQFTGGFLPDGQSQPSRTFTSSPVNQANVANNVYVLQAWQDVVGDGNIPLFVQLVTGGTPVNLRGNTDQQGNTQVPRYQPCKVVPGPAAVSSVRLDGGFVNPATNMNNLVQVVAGVQSVVRLQLYDGVTIPGTNTFGNAIPAVPGSQAPSNLQFTLTAYALGKDTYGQPIPNVTATAAWDSPSGYFQFSFTTMKAAQYQIFVVGSDSTNRITNAPISNTGYFQPITLVGPTSGPKSFVAVDAVTTTPATGLGSAASGDTFVTYVNAADSQGNIGQAITNGASIQCTISAATLAGQSVVVSCGTPAVTTQYLPASGQSLVAASSASCVPLPSPLGRYKLSFSPITTATYSVACTLITGPGSCATCGGALINSPYSLQVNPTGPSADKSQVTLPGKSNYYEVCTSDEYKATPSPLTAYGQSHKNAILVTIVVRDKFGNLRAGYNDSQVMAVSLVAVDGSVVQWTQDPIGLDQATATYTYTLYAQTAGQFKVWVEIPRGTVVAVSQPVGSAIYVCPGPMTPASQVSPPPAGDNSAIEGVGLFQNSQPVLFTARDRFNNLVMPAGSAGTGQGIDKYGSNYAPVAPQINPGSTGPMTASGSTLTAWAGSTPPAAAGTAFAVQQQQQNLNTLFSYTVAPPPTGRQTQVGTDACDPGKTHVAGQPISFNLNNVQSFSTLSEFNIFTVPSSQIFLNTNAAYNNPLVGPGTWTPPKAGLYQIHIFDTGFETTVSLANISCTVKTGGISASLSGVSVSPTSVIAGTVFNVTVTFRDTSGALVVPGDPSQLIPGTPTVDLFQVSDGLKGQATNENLRIVSVQVVSQSVQLTVVAKRAIPSAVVSVAYTQPAALGLPQVTITGSQQIVVLANAPWYGSVPADAVSRASPATAGVTTTLTTVTFQDLYNNTISQTSFCATCRLYLTFRRASAPSSLQLVPATVNYDGTGFATVTFTPTVSDYHQMSSFGWYVSDVPALYTPYYATDLPAGATLDATVIPVCASSAASAADPVCVTPDVTPVAAGTFRHTMTAPTNQAMFIFPGTPATITSVPLYLNSTAPTPGTGTTGQVTAGQAQTFALKIADAFGNGWRFVSLGAGGSVVASESGMSITLSPPVNSDATPVVLPVATAPPPSVGFAHDDTRPNLGWYTGAFVLTRAGVWPVQVSAAGTVVFSQSVSVTTLITVNPYLPWPQNTIFATPSPARIRAGTSSNTTITLRDVYGNVIFVPPSSPIKVSIQFYAQEQTPPPNSPNWQACTNSHGLAAGLTPPGEVAMLAGPTPGYRSDGKLQVVFTPRYTGLFYAWVQVGPNSALDPASLVNAPTSGNANIIPPANDNIGACNRNPFEFSVIPGDIDPPSCTIEGPGVQAARVLVSTQFQVVLRDRFGNQIATPYALTASPTQSVFPTVRNSSATIATCQAAGVPPVTPAFANVLNGTFISTPTDNGDGSASYQYTPQKAGQLIYMSVSLDTAFINAKNLELQKINGGDLPVTLTPDDGTMSRLGRPPCLNFSVHASFTNTISSTTVNAVATVPSVVDATGYDETVFQNPVDFGVFGYVMTMNRRADQLAVASFASTAHSTYDSNLLQTQHIQHIPFIPSWEGTYDVILTQNPTDPTDPKVGTRVIPPFVWVLNVTAAKCSETPPYTLPFRCPNGQCAASQAACGGLPTCAGTATYCSGGSTCSNCNQPVLSGGGLGYTQLFAEVGAAVSTCPTVVGGVRSSTANCPTPPQCPWGWSMCSDAYTCSQNNPAPGSQQCPPGPTCPPDRPVACLNGRCATRAENCGSQVTCAAGVLCPDGSCAASRDACQEILRCDAYSNPSTNSSSTLMVRCAAGTCRAGWADCPVPRACPAGWTLCENGQCVLGGVDTPCPVAHHCNTTEHRCADGTCRQNHLLCPSQTTCPPSQVLCADGSCADDLAFCRVPQSCPASNPVFCPDGSCAISFSACATSKTCPLTRPTLCPDGSCAVTVKDCVPTMPCPSYLDVRCPDGSCRSSVADCPTGVQCPPQAPVRCSDGRCGQAPEVCTDPAKLVCAVGLVRCPAGECAATLEQCPTPVTCPAGLQRCVDGTCRVTCNINLITSALAMCASAGLITCPNSHSGVACAASLAECPAAVSCPWNKPVRCMDQSCAVSSDDCPPAPSPLSSSQFGCVAGGISTVSLSSCGTSVTCPASAPVKCWDDTCRIVADDCPLPPRCPRDISAQAGNPYTCFDGSCANSFACPVPTTCPSNLPVKCSWWRPLITYSQNSVEAKQGGATACVATVDDCVNLFGDNPLTVTQSQAQGGGITVLPQYSPRRGAAAATAAARTLGDCPTALQQRTRTGACVTSVTYTPQAPCPLNTQFQCDGGLCVRGTALAALTTATGTNPADVCPAVATDGCDAGLVRCHDGSCAPKGSCIDDSDSYNACPASRPYRCTNGYCASSATRCPLIPETVGAADACAAATPIRCADGSCRLLASQCPVIKPCYSVVDATGKLIQTNNTRCVDGTCGPPGQSCPSTAGSSPIQSTRRCPSSRPYRCPSGLCAVAVAKCADDPSAAWNGGCPLDPTTGLSSRCRNTGFCSTAAGDCPGAATPNPTNGCKVSGQVKCWDGSCAPSLAGCNTAPSGCPVGTPVLCPSGTCVATSSSCSAASTCSGTTVRCPNGQCAATYDKCLTALNCPSGQIRCADGDCKPVRAQFTLPTLAFDPNTMCIPTVVCDPRTPYMCADGACVSNTDLCRPVHQCASGVYCAYTTSCLASSALCPSPDNFRNKTTTGLNPVCPSSQPALCPDGSCRRSPAHCHNSAQQPLCAPEEVRCWDGTCESSYAACVSRSVLLRKGIPTVNGAAVTVVARTSASSSVALMPVLPSDFLVDGAQVCTAPATIMCPDGECVTDQSLCQPITSCPTSHPLRCWDGSCINANTTTACARGAAPDAACPSGSARCEDGLCRPGDQNACPVFTGCPANRPATAGGSGLNPYYCSGLPNSPCVADGPSCKAAQPDPTKDAQVCVNNCERDNPVRVTQVSVSHSLASEARDITVDVSFSAANVIRTQVVIPAGPIAPGNQASAGSPRVVTFQPMPFLASRVRKAVTNNPTGYDNRDVQLLSTPFSCSVDGSAGATPLDTYFQVSGAIDRQYFQPQFAPNPLNANTGNTQVPCEYQGHFTAEGQSPWTTADQKVTGSVTIDATTFSIAMSQPYDTISLSGTLEPWSTDPALFTKWVPNAQVGRICMCFNVTSQTPVPAPVSGKDIPAANFQPNPGYPDDGIGPPPNYPVGSSFCVHMERTADGATISAVSFVVQPASPSCPAQNLGQGIRSLTLTHTPADYDCGTTAQALTATLTNIPAEMICFATLAHTGPYAGQWACTEPDEAFFNSSFPQYAPLIQYRAWDGSLGLPLTRAQGIVQTCDPNVFYAFMQSAPPTPPKPPVVTCNLWCQYWRVILGVVLGVGIFSCLAAFAIWRLVRYRRKYKEKQEHLRDLKDRAMELDQYHGGLGVESEEDDIHMMANPLVIEMQDLELQIRKVEQDMNVQGDQERLQIDQLEMERQRLYAEIQRVKEAMQKQHVSTGAPARADPTPQPLHGYTPQHTNIALPGQTSNARLVPQNTTSESTIHHEFGQVRRPAKKKDF